jgi:release factor glutamine methyltransferase
MPHVRTPVTPGGSVGAPPASFYPAREDTFLLLPYARVERGLRFLEVGTGAGGLALEAARHGARVVATDLNPHALRHLVRLAWEEGLPVEAVRTDLARGLGRFDRILFNPPYLPTRPEQQDPDPWHNLALDGGRDGCRVAARWVDELDEHLRPGGDAFLLVSTVQAPGSRSRMAAGWRARGGTVEVVAERRLEGEQLEVWRFALGGWEPASPLARRSAAPRRGSRARHRSPSAHRTGSNPAPGPERTTAPDAA